MRKDKNKKNEEAIRDLEDLFGYNELDIESRQPKKHRKKRKHVVARSFFGLIGIMIIAGLIMITFVLQDTQNVKWNSIYDYLSEASTIYDDKGKEIGDISSSSGNRVIAKYQDMPKDLVNAFVAIEDKTFWEHHGFNFVRMAGAVWESLNNDSKIGGTSTITQQLARNLWLSESKSERTITRKLKEAYYGIQLERHLSKEEIIEAYLNTIALGQNTLGVQSASQKYFSKDINDLSLLECAALAGLAKAPSQYSYFRTVSKDDALAGQDIIIKKGNNNVYIYNSRGEDRVELVLELMKEQGYITASQHAEVSIDDLQNLVNPNISEKSDEAQFFVDYTIKVLCEDLAKEYDLTEQEANQMVYSGGLKIYTTLSRKMQNAAEDEFKKNCNFPRVANLKKDNAGNILNDDRTVILYKYSNYFDKKGRFTLNKDEFKILDNGDLLIKKGKRLIFYDRETEEGKSLDIEFRSLYQSDDEAFYSINGGVINIPGEFKSLDSKGNVIIKKSFIDDVNYRGFMEVKKKKVVFSDWSYSLRQKIQQSQASVVIINHKNGHIKAMIGGRNIEGKMNYNRATSPRQPGSSIKPIAVYAPALESGAKLKKIKNGRYSYGTYWTAGSTIRDEYMTYQGKVWPRNWYGGYRGSMSLRRAVEQSVNTIAVRVYQNIGRKASVDFLESLGITSIVTDKDKRNDLKPAALALGGMVHGISPLEMAGAYATFPNKGMYIEPKPYSEVKTKSDQLVLECKPTTRRAMDVGTAFIMNDILRTTVSNGIAARAAMDTQPVAGKTGTTTDNYDAWFVGSTPKYTAAVWIGNDINIELAEGSSAAAKLWSRIMTGATKGDKRKKFSKAPYNVEKKYYKWRYDYYIEGTTP